MASRLRPLTQPVEIVHDGEEVTAEYGESLAHALLADDRVVLTRSPKLHRPRGPHCLRGACEGCLVRVDGVANVMACRHRVTGGERVETQNVVGSRELDLLAATDFLFPHGIDHHRLFAGVRGVSGIVTALARRVAGLGKLPDAVEPVRQGELIETDVLVVGGGGAGLAAARELGALATLVDDGLELGGTLSLLSPHQSEELIRAARDAGARLHPRTTAVGVYPGPDGDERRVTVLLAGEGSASLVFARSVLLATGVHDRTPDFPGNDLPGILSARAGLSLIRGGICPGERVALVGSSELTEALAAELGDRVVIRAAESDVLRAEGRLRVKHLVVRENDAERGIGIDALLQDGTGSSAFELAVQAGGTVRFDAARGYGPVTDAQGRAGANVWCAGRVRGAPSSPAEDGARVAAAVRRALA